MAQLLVGIVIFIVVFILKLIFGAAGGALKAVESVQRDNDFERYTGGYSGSASSGSGSKLIGNKSGADIIREYRELYEDDIISYEEYEEVKRNILSSRVG